MPPNSEGGMRFEDQGDEFGAPPERSGGFDLSGKLVAWGLVSSRQEAQYVLIAIAVLAFVGAAFFMIRGSTGNLPPPPPTGIAAEV